MRGTFEVESAALTKQVTRLMSFKIYGLSAVLLLALYFLGIFEIKKQISLFTWMLLLLVALAIPLFAYLTRRFIAWSLQGARITIDSRDLHGVNYWSKRQSIPLREIIELRPFSKKGVDAMVAVTFSSGEIYISTKTERYEEIIEFLGTFLPPEVK